MAKITQKQTLGLLAVIVLGALWIGFTAIAAPATTNGGTPAPRAGFLAPDFSLTTFEGESLALADFKGTPLIINFWASWCGPCRAEMPAMQKVYETYRERGFTILAVNATSGDSVSAAKAFADQYELTMPVLLDLDGSVSELYQVNSFPTTFFVDHEGTITEVIIGGPIAEALLAVRAEQLIEAVH